MCIRPMVHGNLGHVNVWMLWACIGAGKGSEIAVTSTLFVETVEKKPGAVSAKRFHGDASRVVASGNGLKKGFAGRAANFTLDIKDAGLTHV